MWEPSKPASLNWIAILKHLGKVSWEAVRSIAPRPVLPERSVRILLWGSKRSGKTTILYRWKLESFIPTAPTFGLLEESFTYQCPASNGVCSVTVAEIGRDPQSYERQTSVVLSMKKDYDDDEDSPRESKSANICRCLRLCCSVCFRTRSRPRVVDFGVEVWTRIAGRANAVVYVVDASCRASLMEMFDDINVIMENDHLTAQTAKVVILANKQDVVGAVRPNEIERMLDLPVRLRDRCRIWGCSALTGDNVEEALSWLAKASGRKAE